MLTYRTTVEKKPTFKKALVRLGRTNASSARSRPSATSRSRSRTEPCSGSSASTAPASPRSCGRRRDPPAHQRQDRGARPSEHAARARRRLQGRSDRARERRSRRARRRAHTRGAGGEVRGDRGVRRARRLHGHADAHLLLRHVRPPRVLGGDQHGARHPPDRRGALGRRRALQGEVVRQDARALLQREHDPAGQPRPEGHPQARRRGHLAAQGRDRHAGRGPRSSRPTSGSSTSASRTSPTKTCSGPPGPNEWRRRDG